MTLAPSNSDIVTLLSSIITIHHPSIVHLTSIIHHPSLLPPTVPPILHSRVEELQTAQGWSDVDDEDGGVMNQWIGGSGWLGWTNDKCTGGQTVACVVEPVAGLCPG